MVFVDSPQSVPKVSIQFGWIHSLGLDTTCLGSPNRMLLDTRMLESARANNWAWLINRENHLKLIVSIGKGLEIWFQLNFLPGGIYFQIPGIPISK